MYTIFVNLRYSNPKTAYIIDLWIALVSILYTMEKTLSSTDQDEQNVN